MILKYKSSKTIQNQSDFKTDSARIISNLKILLHELDTKTEVFGNKIVFGQMLKDHVSGAGSGPGTIMPLREGEIQLFMAETDKTKVVWEIKLNSLLFFTFLLGAIAGVLSYAFLDTKLIGSIIILFAAWVSSFLIWRQYAIFEMNDLIQTSTLM